MTAKTRTLVIALAAAAAIAAYWFLLLTPKQEQAAKLADQISAKQGELDKAEQEVAAYTQAKAGYKANYVTVTKLGKAVPTDDDVRSLMVQIDSAADRAGVEFLTIDVGKGAVAAAPAGGAAAAVKLPPGASMNPAGFGVMPFTFTFKGSFFRLSDFLRRMERFVTVSNARIDVTGRLLSLDSIKLVPDPTEGFPRISAAITATSFLLPQDEGLTAGATAAAPAAAASGAATPASAPAPAAPPATTATVGAAG